MLGSKVSLAPLIVKICESIMVVPTLKFGILIKTYESTVNIVHLYNLAKLRKWKNKYTIQFLKVESPPSQPILASPALWSRPPPLNEKNSNPPQKKFWEPKSPPSYRLGGGDGHCGPLFHFSRYHFKFWSNRFFSFAHATAITISTLLCLARYSLLANVLHSAKRCCTVSHCSLHNLH